MTAATIADPDARIKILTGDDWGPWLVETLQAAEVSVSMSVYMLSHHWRVPTRHKLNLLAELEDCARRNLVCRGILAGASQIKSREVFNRDAAEALTVAGWKIRQMQGARLLHEKIILIDRRISVIGSHNISKASLASNHDTSIAIESAPLARQMFELFWRRWRDASEMGSA